MTEDVEIHRLILMDGNAENNEQRFTVAAQSYSGGSGMPITVSSLGLACSLLTFCVSVRIHCHDLVLEKR